MNNETHAYMIKDDEIIAKTTYDHKDILILRNSSKVNQIFLTRLKDTNTKNDNGKNLYEGSNICVVHINKDDEDTYHIDYSILLDDNETDKDDTYLEKEALAHVFLDKFNSDIVDWYINNIEINVYN